MLTVKQYETDRAQSPFARWFDDLNAPAAAKGTAAITRLANGNFWDVKAVGSGVSERRIDFGPGYRVYFARDGQQIIILLGG
jgi:putative addiction module killer protein